MEFGVQIYRQTKTTTRKHHECETHPIKMLNENHANDA